MFVTICSWYELRKLTKVMTWEEIWLGAVWTYFGASWQEPHDIPSTMAAHTQWSCALLEPQSASHDLIIWGPICICNDWEDDWQCPAACSQTTIDRAVDTTIYKGHMTCDADQFYWDSQKMIRRRKVTVNPEAVWWDRSRSSCCSRRRYVFRQQSQSLAKLRRNTRQRRDNSCPRKTSVAKIEFLAETESRYWCWG